MDKLRDRRMLCVNNKRPRKDTCKISANNKRLKNSDKNETARNVWLITWNKISLDLKRFPLLTRMIQFRLKLVQSRLMIKSSVLFFDLVESWFNNEELKHIAIKTLNVNFVFISDLKAVILLD